MARKHNLDEVLKSLGRKNDIRIKGLTIYMLSDKVWDKNQRKMVDNPKKVNDIGNGSWGKIDYLTKYCNFSLVKVDKF